MGGQNTSPFHLGAFWTVLPESVSSSGIIVGPVGGPDTPPPSTGEGNPDQTIRLRFSATVAFRLYVSTVAANSFKLSFFESLLDWPQRMLEANDSGTFTVTLSTSPLQQYYFPTLVSSPDSEVWRKLFTANTDVSQAKPADYNPRDQKPIRSYPRRELAGYVRDLHAGAQYVSPTTVIQAPIPINTLRTSLSPVTASRLQASTLASALDGYLSTQASAPDTWAIPRSRFSGLSTAARRPYELAQVNKYFRRLNEPSDTPDIADPVKVKAYDFHQLAAMALLQPAVARALGLILDFEVEVPANVYGEGDIQLGLSYNAFQAKREDVYYKTAYRLTPSLFEIRSQQGLLDVNGRYLQLGDPNHFHVENGLDVDSAALKAVDIEEQTATSTQATDLPALKTTGIGINRIDNAPKLAEVRRRDRKRFNAAYGKNSDTFVVLDPTQQVGTPSFVNFAEDLIRGFRFDVWDESQGKWFSLHSRQGRYTIGRTSPLTIAVENEEGFTSITPLRPKKASRSQQLPSKDEFYLSESIMRWGGWSLSVPRAGRPIKNDDTMLNRTSANPNAAVAFPRPDGAVGDVVANFIRPLGLPRLRFGRTYRFRARVVDTAGNSAPFDETIDPAALGNSVSAPVKFQRFDPVESPTLVLRAKPGPGESIHELVVRSESRDDLGTGLSERLVPPPPTSQWIAELHGGFDPSIDNDQASAQYTALLEKREGRTWKDSPVAQPIPGDANAFVVPVQQGGDVVEVPYLPDPAARRAFIRNLPGVTTGQWITYGSAPWPDVRPGKLKLRKGAGVSGPGSYVPVAGNGDTLDITLNKGDIRTLQISSALATTGDTVRSGADLFGLFDWMVDHAFNNQTNTALTRNFIEDTMRLFLTSGAHRAITPPQAVRLVHAIRRPLAAPVFAPPRPQAPNVLEVIRRVGDTTAAINSGLNYSPRSTGRLDIKASWDNYFDAGPGGSDPTVPTPRSTQVYARELDREAVAEGVTNDVQLNQVSSGETVHEFGDTRHYKVTYTPKATTSFLQYFRETKRVDFRIGGVQELESDSLLTPQGLVSAAPVSVVGVTTGKQYVEGVDYTLDRSTGRITRLFRPLGAGARIGEYVDVSFVRGVIDWDGAPQTVHVPATARPQAPIVHSIVPSFRWNRKIVTGPTRVQSSRSAGGLRIWLDRPWHSSGENEYLAVIVTQGPFGPAGDSKDLLTQAGTDAISDSRNTKQYLTAENLLGGNALPPTSVSLAETGRLVTAVPYAVQYHSGRDQWFVDISVNPNIGSSTAGYFPFVRLALARYQPYAKELLDPALPITAINLPSTENQTLSLSAVVQTDFVQVAPQRDTYVAKSGQTISVTVQGESYVRLQNEGNFVGFPAGRGPTKVVATLQERDTTISDPVLCWRRAGTNPATELLGALGRADDGTQVTLTASKPVNGYSFTWTGALTVPNTGILRAPQYRVLVEEFESHYADKNGSGTQLFIDATAGGIINTQTNSVQSPDALRCVFQDMISLEGL